MRRIIVLLLFALIPICVYSSKSDVLNDDIVLIGKWVAKGGNLWADIYNFNPDKTFSYQHDDFSMSGTFTCDNGVIIFKVKEKYFSNETIEVNEEYKYRIKKIDAFIIEIGDTFYRNINTIKETDDWYGNGN